MMFSGKVDPDNDFCLENSASGHPCSDKQGSH